MRLNMNGIGFSHDGYAGEYTQAWTLDGIFNTEFINGKTIKAVTIQGARFEGEECVFGAEDSGTLIIRPSVLVDDDKFGTEIVSDYPVKVSIDEPVTVNVHGLAVYSGRNGNTDASLSIYQGGRIEVSSASQLVVNATEGVNISSRFKINNETLNISGLSDYAYISAGGESIRVGGLGMEITKKHGNTSVIGSPVLLSSQGGTEKTAMLELGRLYVYNSSGEVTATYDLSPLKF